MKNILFIFVLIFLALQAYAQVSIGGKITCLYGEPMFGVVVRVADLTIKDDLYTITNKHGEFSFCNIDTSHLYNIDVAYVPPPDSAAKGLDIVDLELLYQHTKGTKPFSDDQKYLAEQYFGFSWTNGIANTSKDGLVDFYRYNIINNFFQYQKPNEYVSNAIYWFFAKPGEPLRQRQPVQRNYLGKITKDMRDLNWIIAKVGDFDGSACK